MENGLDGDATRTASEQKDSIRRLRRRLQTADTFLLPEAWDVAGARVMAEAGFDVIGISGTALGWSLGYAADARLGLDDLLLVATRIAAGSRVPVIADLEGVLGRRPAEIGHAVAIALGAGCIGVTFSDGGRLGRHGMVEPALMAQAIQAAKAATLEARLPAVIIAATESFLAPNGTSPFEATAARAEDYFAAGADCVLVPGLQQLQIIERLGRVVDGPLAVNIGLGGTLPDLKAFASAGVAYVGFGSSLARSLLGGMRLKAEEMRAFGHFAPLDKAIPAEILDQLIAAEATSTVP